MTRIENTNNENLNIFFLNLRAVAQERKEPVYVIKGEDSVDPNMKTAYGVVQSDALAEEIEKAFCIIYPN